MRDRLRSILVAALLSLAVAGSVAANDNSQPVTAFGGAYVNYLAGSYEWVEATDDGTYRYDIYSTAGGVHSLTVKSLLDVTILATVTGTSPAGPIDCCIIDGVLTEYYQNDNPGGASQNITETTIDLESSYIRTEWTSILEDGSSSESWAKSRRPPGFGRIRMETRSWKRS